MIEAQHGVQFGSDTDGRDPLARLAESSVELILGLQDATGAYPASPTFSAYRGYCWFRDGAFIADAMSAAGASESAERFFDWCSRILVAREPAIVNIVSRALAGDPVPDAQMLPTRFTFAGEDGDDQWWDFQLDGFGTWLWAVAEHSRRHGTSLTRWTRAIELSVDYLTSSWQRPCFDWWEENASEVHVSTLACVAAGLSAVADAGAIDGSRLERALAASESIRGTIVERGLVHGYLAKWLGSTEVDASALAAVAPLGLFPASGEIGSRTLLAIDGSLNVGGGVHRYLDDTFFGGGQWPLLSCLLGLGYAAAGDRRRAVELLAWAAGTANGEGALPEQVGDHLLDPSRYQEWEDRWGPVARPLLWSHAMFVRLAVEVSVVEVAAA
ncbi:glycoside hydrolase family 15 protein [Lacisediminihabitans sp.]|uniref:glycoside hydrolase family 15 protein n=1 Tax=Lacisediminihabitans sp. TaxID=2787631 RepID=UPI00374D294A